MKQISEWSEVTPAVFRDEIAPLGQPAVLRALVGDWPAVELARQSPQAIADYLARFDTGQSADALLGPPSIEGRFFYRDDMRGLNFERRKQPVSALLKMLLASLADPHPPALSMQGIKAAEAMPGFTDQNRLPLADIRGEPRLWVGNKVSVATNFDLFDNIACVVAGRRRFTLFPPDQLPNLYVGPFDFSPAGAPVSMVDAAAPDVDRYPRYRDAQETAQVGELEPGDAIFIPYMWWHGVESLDPFNLLCNYWWNGSPPPGSPYDVLMHASLVLGSMPDRHRAIWKGMLDTMVFRTDGEPLEHLRPEHRGALGGLDPQQARAMSRLLGQKMSRS